jgi:hypothetical protein
LLTVLAGAPATRAGSANHEGDLVITWGNTLVIEDTDYTQKGDIYVEDGGKLVVRNASLTMLCDYDGQYAFRVRGGELDMVNVQLASSRTRVDVWVSGNGHVSLSGVTGLAINPWLSGNSSAFFFSSELGCVDVSDGSSVEMRSSVVQYFIRLGVDSPVPVEFSDVAPARYDDTKMPSTATAGEFSLSLKDTYVGGWVVRVGIGADVTVKDSELSQVDMRFADATGRINALQLGLQRDWDSSSLAVRGRASQVRLVNTIVTDGWFMFVSGSINLQISDSAVALSLRERSSVELTKCSVSWFEEVDHEGVVTFSGTTLGDYIQVVETQARWQGDVHVLAGVYVVGWYSSSVTRVYGVRVTNTQGSPVPTARIEVKDESGKVVLVRTTDVQGEAEFGLTFTGENYRDTWTVSVLGYSQGQTVTFLSSTPLALVVSR